MRVVLEGMAGKVSAYLGLAAIGAIALVACNSAIPGPGGGGRWFLDVENLSPITVVVTPWDGGPKTTLACQQSIELTDGFEGTPPLPWDVVVVRKTDGKVILDQLAGAHGSPSQEGRVETDEGGDPIAFMRDAGGSGPADATSCSSP
jgi:hypothetical protein